MNRTIFVKSPYTALGVYAIPVTGHLENFTLATDYFQITIEEAKERFILQIVEMPKTVSVRQNTNLTVPILLKNTGKVTLTGITGRIENAEQCVKSADFSSVKSLEADQVDSMTINLLAKDQSVKCNALVIIGSTEKAYTFSNLEIVVTPPPPLLPELSRINLLLLLIVFAGVLIASRLSKVKLVKNKRKKKKSVQAFIIIFYLVLSLVIFFAFYWAYNYFGLGSLIKF